MKPVDQAVQEAPADETASTEATTPEAEVEAIPDEGEAPIAVEPAEQTEQPEDIPAASEGEVLPGDTPAAEPSEPEIEVFYTFTWAGRGGRARNEGRAKPAGGAKPRGKGGKPGGSKGKPRGEQGPKTFSARPDRKKDQIDPDNPFAAALMGLKDKG